MELIQVKPSAINLRFPDTLHAQVTVQNLTLHQLAVRVLCSNPDNFIITPDSFRMESFEQRKLHIQVKYYQQALLSNYLGNKIVLYCYDQDQQGELWNEAGMSVERFKRIGKIQIQFNCTADMQNYVILQPKKKHLMLKIHRYVGTTVLSSDERHSLITYLETLGEFKCLHILSDGHFIAQYKQLIQNNISVIQEIFIGENVSLYAIGTMPVITKDRLPPPVEKPSILQEEKMQMEAQEVMSKQRELDIEEKKQEQPAPVIIKPSPIKTKKTNELKTTFIGQQSSIKGTFAINCNKKKRRNKSLEAIHTVYNSSDDDSEDDQSKLFVNDKMVVLDPISVKIPLKRQQRLMVNSQEQTECIKEEQFAIKLPRLEQGQTINCVAHPIAMHVSSEKYFILFANVVVVYDVNCKVSQGKIIPLEESAAFNEHKSKTVFMKDAGEYLVLGCDNSFNVVNIKSSKTQWVVVQRKEIHDVAILKSKDLIAVGGRNFSKFSLFGKSTQRSNIKLYQLDEGYNHLLTYDIENAGVISQLQQVIIQEKEVLVALGDVEGVQTLYLMNVVSGTKIQLVGRFDLRDDLALQRIRYLTFSSNNIFGLECMRVGNRDLMVVKRFHIKLNGWKSSIATETCNIKHNQYSVLGCDDRHLLAYSIDREQLTLLDYSKKLTWTFQISPGFRTIKLGFPYVFLLYKSYIEIKKIVTE